jgi:hypothetical protein
MASLMVRWRVVVWKDTGKQNDINHGICFSILNLNWTSQQHNSSVLPPYQDFGFLINNGSICICGPSAEPICTEINMRLLIYIQRITRLMLNRCNKLALPSGLLHPRGKKTHSPLYKRAHRPEIYPECEVQMNIPYCCQDCNLVFTLPISY